MKEFLPIDGNIVLSHPGAVVTGTTGSGRQIAALHALTDGVINEIIAHATAAVYFDSKVDTIFEIGGQDAKYTYITNAVPSDYAMNEACSAGTGSFLSAKMAAKGLMAMAKGHKIGVPQGDVRQLPGVFIIDTTGHIRFSHHAANPADHPQPETLLAALDGESST